MNDYMPTRTKTSKPAVHSSTTTPPDEADGLRCGTFTAEQLVDTYVARIEEVNHEFHAVIETNPDATADARLLDMERRLRGSRGALHGLSILLKDNIPALDNTETTCGSIALIGAKPSQEADVVTALRSAGAVILGKTNMAEWSGFRSSSGCSSWSARGGQTKGIFYPGMKASGSSSGSAVAVALGLCFAALGTETCYSIVPPAEKSGVIGFKPTRNLISSTGIIPASQRLDTVGLITRKVSDAVQILLEIIYHSSHHALQDKLKMIEDIVPCCSTLSLRGVRIGIPWRLHEMETLHIEKCKSFRNVLAALKHAGAEPIHDVQITGAEEYEALTPSQKQIILDTDMKMAINSYLSSLATNPQNILDMQALIDFTKSCPEEGFPQRNVEGFERAQATDPENELYQHMLARDAYFAGEGGIQGALNRHRCDVLLVPTLSVTMQTFAVKAGIPVMSVPMGSYPNGTEVEKDAKNGLINIAPGIPFSVFIFGRATKYEDVLRVGYILEQMLRTRETLRPDLEAKTEIGDRRVGRT